MSAWSSMGARNVHVGVVGNVLVCQTLYCMAYTAAGAQDAQREAGVTVVSGLL